MRVIDEENMLAVGKKFAHICRPPCIVYFEGNLGAGKTTLIRGILQGMGYTGRVKSPTYSLLEVYPFDNFQIVHIDLYRIHHVEEVEHLGIRDIFDQNTIGLVEWANLAESKLPAADIICNIEIVDDERLVDMHAITARGHEILKLFL